MGFGLSGAGLAFAVTRTRAVPRWRHPRRPIREPRPLSACGEALITRLETPIRLIPAVVLGGVRIVEPARRSLLRTRTDQSVQLQWMNRELRAAKNTRQATRRRAVLADMSHEIGRGRRRLTELVLDTTLTSERRQYMDRQCPPTLLTVINDILDFSRMEAGKFTLDPSTSTARHLGDLAKTMALRARRRRSADRRCRYGRAAYLEGAGRCVGSSSICWRMPIRVHHQGEIGDFGDEGPLPDRTSCCISRSRHRRGCGPSTTRLRPLSRRMDRPHACMAAPAWA
jgi:signal transduction histidine kinase